MSLCFHFWEFTPHILFYKERKDKFSDVYCHIIGTNKELVHECPLVEKERGNSAICKQWNTIQGTECSWWLSGKESTCQCRKRKRLGFDPWVRKIPWRRKWQPISVFLPGKSHGQRNLVGYSPWDCKIRHDWVSEHRGIHMQGVRSNELEWNMSTLVNLKM